MATTNDIKEYTSYDIDEFLVHEDSVLNLYAQQDAIGIDQAFEGVPGGNIIFGGLQIRKKKYDDTANGIWIGIDSDGIAKMAIGDASGGFTWDGTTLTITGGGFIPEGGAAQDVNDNATTISGTKITTGTITASKMNVSTLSSITADIGSITSGTITSALIRTSSSGARVEIDDTNDRIEVYDSGGTERMRLDQDELNFYNSSGTRIGYITTPATTNFEITTPTGNALIINAQGTNILDAIILQANSVQKMAITDTDIVISEQVDFNNNNLLDCGNIEANDTTSDIGTSSIPFDHLYINDVYWEPNTSNPTTDGQARYFDSGGTEGLRMQFGGSDFQFDATGV